MKSDTELRKQLVSLIRGNQSHMSLADAVKDFPIDHYNTKPTHVAYSFWHLLEHIRITQQDIINYMTNPDYKELKWPEEYWPPTTAKADQKTWQKTIETLEVDFLVLEEMAADTDIDLLSHIPHGAPGHTYYREFVVIGNHNSYHIGEFAILRQVMGLWPKTHAS